MMGSSSGRGTLLTMGRGAAVSVVDAELAMSMAHSMGRKPMNQPTPNATAPKSAAVATVPANSLTLSAADFFNECSPDFLSAYRS